MTPCFAVEFETPNTFILRGLWFGPAKPRHLVVWVHGLGSSAFGMHRAVRSIAGKRTAVLTFNNRGHDVVSKLRRGKRSILGGTAHEKFTDCIDDIQGAINFVRRQGIKNVYLAGHSTGCQKSIYWAAQKKGRGVKGIILLAPVSDYAAALKYDREGKLARLTKTARQLVRSGKKHALMPESILNDGSLNDAQRFLSLNTPDSAETVFPYEQNGKRPRTLQRVKKPILVLWPEKDEYADRPAKDIAAWFEAHISSPHRVVIVPKAAHSFRGAERRVAREVRKFIRA